MKLYKIWVRVCLEEHDDETDEYRNVYVDDTTGTIEYFTDTGEIAEQMVFESDSAEEAQEFINQYVA